VFDDHPRDLAAVGDRRAAVDDDLDVIEPPGELASSLRQAG
jgi:hypothetical protein